MVAQVLQEVDVRAESNKEPLLAEEIYSPEPYQKSG
jgi:hypothetical protein